MSKTRKSIKPRITDCQRRGTPMQRDQLSGDFIDHHKRRIFLLRLAGHDASSRNSDNENRPNQNRSGKPLETNGDEVASTDPPHRGCNGRGPGAGARAPESDTYHRAHGPGPHRALRPLRLCQERVSAVDGWDLRNRRLPQTSFRDGALPGPVAPVRPDRRPASRPRIRRLPTCPGRSGGSAPSKRETQGQHAAPASCRWGSAG